MEIIRLVLNDYDKWRKEIAALLNQTVTINFPNYIISQKYGYDKTKDIEMFLKNGTAVIFLAIKDNHLIGWIWCHEIIRFNKRKLHIADIATIEPFRGKGIGKELLLKGEEYAKLNGYSGLDLLVTSSNTSAVNFYENVGFSVERLMMCKEFENSEGVNGHFRSDKCW